MQKTAVLIVFLLLGSSSVFSQNKKFGVELAKIKEQKNHLEVDIRNIFSSLSSATILYKRRLNKNESLEGEALKLIRFSLGLSSQFIVDRGLDSFSDLLNSQSDVTFFNGGIGFEKQKMNKHFVHYFGIEGRVSYRTQNSNLTFTTLSNIINIPDFTGSANQLRNYTIGGGILPFFGIKYYITNRLSVGIETGLQVLYLKEFSIDTAMEFRNGVLSEFNKGELVGGRGRISTFFTNLRFLTVGFNF